MYVTIGPHSGHICGKFSLGEFRIFQSSPIFHFGHEQHKYYLKTVHQKLVLTLN